MKHLILFVSALAILSDEVHCAPLFEFKDGDRVAFVGDSFIEREQYHGWLELAATVQFSDCNVTFRNLGWNADTPAGESRCGLSLVQAGGESPEEGWQQLQNQLSTYKPSVIVLGYGMAASLPGGVTPENFQKNLERLLDTAPKLTGLPTRYLILGPPPRFTQDSASPEEITRHHDSLTKINHIITDIAAKRKIPFAPLTDLEPNPSYSQNGIHLTDIGYQAAVRLIEKKLNWSPVSWNQGENADILRKHILTKNEWFFNRSRPANMAYIFGFRKREQGRNASEIPRFDELVAVEESAIAKMRDLSKNTIIPLSPTVSDSQFAKNTPQPHPTFTVADGFEVALWAENPLLHKPTQMNFDPRGRLWVASSMSYPQVEVGQTPDDKILILEDTDHNGSADKSTVFASGLMMPTAVIPGAGGAYVAQSTDFLHFEDTDGDDISDIKTRVLTGFGTEDTHHNLHTLRRSPDGRLWMNQSIYTRSDVETPSSVVRLKSGGVYRFDPRSSELKVMFRGLWNTWGHQFDKYGQSFLTDGAGSDGINWGLPDAMYSGYAGAQRILDGVSPGKYPKFCGLEIIESSHFPTTWQGNLITCDFRAHRVVRFSITDQGAGYTTQALPDLIQTNDVNFRPIDIKIGPDGALYVADWSNPIINHGEVDFRDPRRDREHGRIWKITYKGHPTSNPRDFTKLPENELLASLTSHNRYDREQAIAVLTESKSKTLPTAIKTWKESAKDDRTMLAALWLSEGRNTRDVELMKKVIRCETGEVRAAGIRVMGDYLSAMEPQDAIQILKGAIADEFPRVRIEAIRVLSKLSGWEAMDAALTALNKPTDQFINYALWLTIQEHGEEWLAALFESKLNLSERDKPLEFILANLPAAKTASAIARLLPKPLPKDGSGPWLNLALKTGDAAVIDSIFQQLVSGGFDQKLRPTVLRGINEAITQRRIKLTGNLNMLLPLINDGDQATRIAAISLAGEAPSDEVMGPCLLEISTNPEISLEIRIAAIDTLGGNFRPIRASFALLGLAEASSPPAIRQHAVLALARFDRKKALPMIVDVLGSISDAQSSRQFWRQTLSLKGISKQLATALSAKPLSPEIAKLTLQHVPDVAEHDALLKVLRSQAGTTGAQSYTAEIIAKIAAESKEKGDPHRGEIVYNRAELACTACHGIGGAGGKVGPDLTSIGASAPLDYIVESVVNPGAKVKEGFHSVMIETKDGKAIMGQLVKSGNGSSVVRDGAGNEITIADEMISKKSNAGSLMPGNLIANLSDKDIHDLFKFLSQLGTLGEFDATKSHAPKVWAVIGFKSDLQVPSSKGDPMLAWTPINSSVNGSLSSIHAKAAMGTSSEIMAATKLQLAKKENIKLEFPGDFHPLGIWIDGQPSKDGTATLEPGIHKIVIQTTISDHPIRMTCTTGTFLPEWP